MTGKTTAETAPGALTGLGRLWAIPRVSYSTAELAALLGDWWPERYALQKIRSAVQDGLLHPFRRGTVNEFTREEVVRFVCQRFPYTAGEMINSALLSGFGSVYVPTALLLKALEEAAAGRWKPDPMLFWPPGGQSSETPVTGTRVDPDFPAAVRDSHVARVDRRSPDDRVPHIRTRIRAASESKGRRREKREAEAAARAKRRVTKPLKPVSDEELKTPSIDDDPAEISLDVIKRVHDEPVARRPRRSRR